MQPAFPYRLKGQQLWLSPERCIFWEEERALILSDLHFGKTGHFRKSGIAVPQSVYQEDLFRLLSQIQYFQPLQLFIVGDLFHSHENKELDLFRKWRENFPQLIFRLIKGNHDILHEDWYRKSGIEVSPVKWETGVFSFIHDITEETNGLGEAPDSKTLSGVPGGYSFSGHLHPGIRINGMGKQSLRFPCFYFGDDYAVLPAFSRFTGMASIDPAPHENVFAILPPDPTITDFPFRGRSKVSFGETGSGSGEPDGERAGKGITSINEKSKARSRNSGTIIQIQ